MIRQCSTTHDQLPGRRSSTGARMPRRIAGAFTIVELLVVVAIIITLLGILIVAVNAAARSGQRTRTIALMGSMKQGLIRFKEAVGYYPPILGVSYVTSAAPPTAGITGDDLRKLFANSVPAPNATYAGGTYIAHMQEYYSTCTLADYLVGYDSHERDGYGRVPGLAGPAAWENETPPAGIRHPGHDGVWNATAVGPAIAQYGALSMRMKWPTLPNPTNPASYSRGTTLSPFPIDQGKVLAPFLELKDERLLAGVNYGSNGLETYFQGDVLPTGQTWDTIPKAIVDYWGLPIRYYRRPYPAGAIGQSYRSVFNPTTGLMTQVPTLSDVYVLRPREVNPGSESPNPYTDGGGAAGVAPNNISSRELDAAEFALLSAGPDKQIVNNALFHKDNADNIVEVGP